MARIQFIPPENLSWEGGSKSLMELCDEQNAGILFGCRQGACGSCLIRIISPSESLSPMQEEEADFLASLKAGPADRLACQCRVLGEVIFETDPEL